MKKNIYSLRESEDYEKDNYGYAESPDEVDSIWIYQGTPLKEDEEDKNWEEPMFWTEYGKLADYLDNDCNWALCSAKMREVIEKHANNSSEITWIPIKVRDGETITPYYAILIEKAFKQSEAVNYEKSRKLKDGKVYLPHFNYDVIKDKDIFTMEDHGSYIFISEQFKNILEKSRLAGLGFEDWYAS